MDKKQLIGAVTLSASVFVLWWALNVWYDRTHPLPPQAINAPADTQPAPTTASTNPAAGANPTTVPATNPATQLAGTQPAAPSITAKIHAIAATQPAGAAVVLGSEQRDPRSRDFVYSIQLALTPNAAIDQVTLNQFPTAADTESGKHKPAYTFETPIADHPETQVLATRALIVNGTSVDLWNVNWTRVSSDAESAAFSTRIADAGGKGIAEVRKTFRILTRAQSSGAGKGYEVSVEQTIRNLDANSPLKVRTVLNGPTPPPPEIEQGSDRTIVVGYAEPKNAIGIVQNSYTDFKLDSATKDLTQDSSKQHFVWAGQASTYFGAFVLPDSHGANDYTVSAVALDPAAEIDRKLSMTFQSPELAIPAGQSASLPKMSVYFGPKWRDVLGDGYYSSWPRLYNLTLIISSKMCAFCTFPWLIAALVKILGFFHLIVRDWGLAIICLVVVVRVCLHPITKRSQVQMMKMGKMGPEIEKLKKKYVDQPDVLNKEMMKVYKQQGLPMLGCLPMFLQTPIWIALWAALQSTFELRQAPFLYGFTWIHDLAKPDELVNLTRLMGHPIALPFGFHLYAINILPLLMAVVTYVNQRYFMPMPPAATPEQKQQQKIQRGMSLIFPLMFYNLPSGLNLYYLTSTSLGIIESKIVRDHIRQHEEAEKAGRVFIPVKATRGARMRDDRAPTVEKRTGLTGRFFDAMAKMQAHAEQLRRDNEKKKGK
ncbi:MAG TPA: membrane protein insertase YidC [Tepidisphaeraceae bacterium]|nr:membrane protein insertase YidC [Tepidisphaeraceae bacterium]